MFFCFRHDHLAVLKQSKESAKRAEAVAKEEQTKKEAAMQQKLERERQLDKARKERATKATVGKKPSHRKKTVTRSQPAPTDVSVTADTADTAAAAAAACVTDEDILSLFERLEYDSEKITTVTI
jgi:hypothetical protein